MASELAVAKSAVVIGPPSAHICNPSWLKSELTGEVVFSFLNRIYPGLQNSVTHSSAAVCRGSSAGSLAVAWRKSALRAALTAAAEGEDAYAGTAEPRRIPKDQVPCYDPADGTFLGCLPALTSAQARRSPCAPVN